MAGEERERRGGRGSRTMRDEKREREKDKSRTLTHMRRLTQPGETGPRNDFTGITPAKSGRYGAAKCDVAIRHSRGLRCPRLPDRPTMDRLCLLPPACPGLLSLRLSLAVQVVTGFSREKQPDNSEPRMCIVTR